MKKLVLVAGILFSLTVAASAQQKKSAVKTKTVTTTTTEQPTLTIDQQRNNKKLKAVRLRKQAERTESMRTKKVSTLAKETKTN